MMATPYTSISTKASPVPYMQGQGNTSPSQPPQQPESSIDLPSVGNFGQVSFSPGFTQTIDTFGAQLGFGAGESVVGATGPSQPAASAGGLSSTSLSGVAGSALGGAGAGGLAASLTGGDPLGGAAGGLLSSGVAASLGVTGPVGLAIGAVGGLLGGSLFGGNKPSDKTMSGGVDMKTGTANRWYAETKSSTGKKYSSKNAQIRDQMEAGVGGFINYLQQNGATQKEGQDANRDLIIQVGSRDGYKAWKTGIDEPYRYGNDFASFNRGIVDLLLEEYDMSDELRGRVRKMADDGQLNDLTAFTQSSSSQDQAQSGRLSARMPTDKKSFSDFLKEYRSS